MKFYTEMEKVAKTKSSDFGGDPVRDPDSGFLNPDSDRGIFNEFLDEIFGQVGARPVQETLKPM